MPGSETSTVRSPFVLRTARPTEEEDATATIDGDILDFPPQPVDLADPFDPFAAEPRERPSVSSEREHLLVAGDDDSPSRQGGGLNALRPVVGVARGGDVGVACIAEPRDQIVIRRRPRRKQRPEQTNARANATSAATILLRPRLPKLEDPGFVIA
jgi:hypothetical protein